LVVIDGDKITVADLNGELLIEHTRRHCGHQRFFRSK
jgi:hypothetical protein